MGAVSIALNGTEVYIAVHRQHSQRYYKAARSAGLSSRDFPVVSRGSNKEAAPPSSVKPLVTINKATTLPSNHPFINCAAIDPSRPAADTNPMPEALASVGNASVETTPKAFHPHVLNALNRDAPTTIVAPPAPVPNAKSVAATAAAAMDTARRRFRPT